MDLCFFFFFKWDCVVFFCGWFILFILLIELFIGPPPVADVRSLTHYGEPHDGNTRFFRSTLFVAAVRSCYGESSLLHGLEWMPPKVSFLVCNGLFLVS